jgi:putative DNA primase/helicase
VLDPVLRERETAMLWAWRGTGKTFVGLAMAYAIASGAKVLRWSAPRPRRVLYVDGELPLQTAQERIAALVAGSELEPPSDDYFKIVTPDVQEVPLPNLSSREAQQALERVLGDVEVLFIDSISTLCRSGRENDSEDWLPVQEWALRLRQCGKTVVFVHHAGKGGSQRGTSRREDVLDLSVRLARPQDYSPDEGARFEVHFEKARTILGDAVRPFEARLVRRKRSCRVADAGFGGCTLGPGRLAIPGRSHGSRSRRRIEHQQVGGPAATKQSGRGRSSQ